MPTPMLGNMGKNWLVRRLQQWHNALRGLRKLLDPTVAESRPSAHLALAQQKLQSRHL